MAHAALKKRKEPSPPRGRLVEIAIGAVWLVGLGAALQLAEILLGRSPLGSAVAGAVIADVVAGFAGVRWDSGEDGKPVEAPADTAIVIRRIGIGMAVSLAAVMVTLVAAALFGWISVDAGDPTAALGFALVRGTALGVRDELFLRGIILVSAARAGVRPIIGAIFAAIAGGAAIALTPEASPGAIALAIGSSFLFATLWQRHSGAWAAIGAHAFWIFLVSAAIRGGLLDVTWKTGSLTSGARSFGAPAWLAAGVCLALALGIRYAAAKKASRPTASRSDPIA